MTVSLFLSGSSNLGKSKHVVTPKAESITENFRSSQAWWLMSVISLLLEAKAGGSLEDRSSRPAWPIQQDPVFIQELKISQAW